jgi:HlyD family secretion protein
MHMLSKRRVMVAIGITGLGAASWWWVRRPPVVDVEIALASVGPLRVSIEETGTTRVRAHTDVNAPVSGRWVPATVKEGDVVSAGTRLGTLYPAPLDASAREQATARVGSAGASIAEAESRRTAAGTALDEARRTQVRVAALGAAGAVAPEEGERARDAVSLRESDVQAADERLRVARYDLAVARAALAGATGAAGGLTLAAPMTGTILAIAEAHERVVPSGTRLLEIGDPRDVEVLVPLLTADALRVREGASVHLTFGAAASTLEVDGKDTVVGRVVRIEPSAYTRMSALGVEEQRVNVIVSVPATAVHVGDRFRADVRITVREVARALRVPASALTRSDETWTIWVVSNGRVDRRPVQLGERGTDQVDVRDGLQAGDTVVLFPGDRLRPRARIRVTRTTSAPP